MSFLVWNNESDAQESLVSLDEMYGCPYLAANGYRMDTWDIVIESIPTTNNNCGFFKPEERLGMGMDDLMPALMPGYIEYAEKPDEFIDKDGPEYEDDDDSQ